MRTFVIVVLIIVVLAGGCYMTSKDAGVIPGADQLPGTTPRPAGNMFVNMSGTLDAKAVNAQATADAAKARADYLRYAQTATAEAARAATAEAAMRMTQEADRISRESTAVVDAQIREQARLISGWTATADAAQSTATSQAQATASAVAATITIRAADLEYQRQAEAATATAQAFVYQQEKRDLELRGKALVNDAVAIGKWVILLLAIALLFAVILRVVWHKTEMTVVQPAANGDKPIIVRNGLIIDPDLSAHAVTDPAKPPDLAVEQRLALKAGDQRVDATRALPRTIFQQPAAPQGTNAITIINPNTMPPANILPDPDMVTVLDTEWSEKP